MSVFQSATGGKRTRQNYGVFQVVGRRLRDIVFFHYKSDAIKFAGDRVKQGHPAHIVSKRTGQITYMLHRDFSCCVVCGNELEGKKHCPLCGRLHVYL